MQSFLKLSNRLPSENVTAASFNALKNQTLSRLFIILDPKNARINCYLNAWNSLCLELEIFISIIQISWYEMFKKPMGADQLLPVLLTLIPDDKERLDKLEQALELAMNIKLNSWDFHVYHFSTLQSAVMEKLKKYIPRNMQDKLDDAIDNSFEEHPERYTELTSQLKNPLHYNLIYINVKLTDFFSNRLRFYGQKIVAYLDAGLHANYAISNLISDPKHYQHVLSNLVLKLMTKTEEEPFCLDKEFIANLNKYVVYLDFLSSVERSNSKIFPKLIELCQKYRVLKENKADIEDIAHEWPDEIRIFLGIPKVDASALGKLNFFAVVDNNIPLSAFIDCLHVKTSTLSDLRNQPFEVIAEIPLPDAENAFSL
jgi:hypothetical protein